MGCCFSTRVDKSAHLSDLRNEVAMLALKENPEEMILRYMVALDEAAPESRETALASLAFVIRLLDKTE